MSSSSLYVPNDADREHREAARQWLLRAAPDVRGALDEWTRGVALLVAGRSWDAVRVPYTLLDPNFDHDTEPSTLRTWVTRQRLNGPVFCDPYRPFVYFLVPPGTDREWPRDVFKVAGLECLGGTEPYVRHVGVPPVDRTERPGLFWLLAPDGVGFRHVDAGHLIAVLRERQQEKSAEPAQERLL
ncbi:hypothetical protein SUDANB145_02839 [Streptomyces sp. enrichment culture]|uniref:hypothetical protein n=1 Tax=Streptomyces sp. enrichment culture TaxID=1795815 RepID=UPI003F544A3A